MFTRLAKDRRGIGHWMAIGLGAAATFVLFSMVFPVAKSMMSNTTNSMNSLNSQMLQQVNGSSSSSSAS
ncbi:hypothetical protein [Sulfoacidibacillus thermotolerans]|uniref:Uncharacterized protein n=1 Tax=Sulfoacidibacillus thermotolerans TaxID=1765684 RepID=A0A2U3D5T0_SULT2|nr:hypothetical protein [Sulfoacidibacillus thermotolerans]PWI56630.1 hypothetical protein BM613_12680 [Sulfoacidibacillus thermotolerans]